MRDKSDNPTRSFILPASQPSARSQDLVVVVFIVVVADIYTALKQASAIDLSPYQHPTHSVH